MCTVSSIVRHIESMLTICRQRCALLTLELIFHPPRNTLELATNPPDPLTILTHKNEWTATLAHLLERCISAKRKTSLPEWVPELAAGFTGDRQTIVGLIVAGEPLDAARRFHELDIEAPLQQALKGLSVVEFAAIHIWDSDAFEDGSSMQLRADDNGTAKRRGDDTSRQAGVQALLGEYLSDDEGDNDDDNAPASDATSGVGPERD